MEIIGSLNSSMLGIQRSQQLLNKTADKIANDEGDLAANAVNLISAETTQNANVDVIKTADEMLKELMYMQH